MDIDNHAYKTILGSNLLPIKDFQILVDLSGWDANSRSFECPTVYGEISYDHPISGKVYMLV